jgi:hypothetical protein
MYMKSLSVRKDKLLTQEAITRWFEYLHKHAPGDTVSALFVATCLFCSPLTIGKNNAGMGHTWYVLYPSFSM